MPTALVTGAADGIGRATAERLVREGWSVLAADRDADRLEWAAQAGIASLVADISSETDNARMVAHMEARFGGLDALALNAGVTGGGSIDSLSMAAFERVVAINLFGPVLGIKAALPLLRCSKQPAIAITSSTMGLAGYAENWAYCSTKHALIGLVRALARELGCEGIRINALCPGPTRTGMTRAMEAVAPEHFAMLTQKVPLQRWADPDEMAAVIAFLVSPAASYVTGHAMVADGGAMVGTGLVGPRTATAPAIPLEIQT
ncbi:SDR family NAD(P)-dependent oxidoreductase [Novosphingobium sp. 9U]|uniref:SDR family NAD(P)-dependent oxidoreductase n=1 Tax=Novosphingobium sp. 9U TaxID=2653158 RepID=UPI0012EF2A91|nr:SDR family oxidoreductase [Novosphingobium sp. 9U]VWX48255.1 putative Levodione reductase [Novosphingobium sp. 9U]